MSYGDDYNVLMESVATTREPSVLALHKVGWRSEREDMAFVAEATIPASMVDERGLLKLDVDVGPSRVEYTIHFTPPIRDNEIKDVIENALRDKGAEDVEFDNKLKATFMVSGRTSDLRNLTALVGKTVWDALDSVPIEGSA